MAPFRALRFLSYQRAYVTPLIPTFWVATRSPPRTAAVRMRVSLVLILGAKRPPGWGALEGAA